MRGILKTNVYESKIALTPVVPTRVQKNHLRPFGGEKVHWPFSCFRLSSHGERGFSATC